MTTSPVEASRHQPTSDPGAAAEHRRGRSAGPLRRELIFALFLVLCYGFFRQAPAWNENTRYDLVRAMVDDHSTRIDAYQQNTGDKAFYDGHYYSDKPPGASIMVIPTYLVIRGASVLQGLDQPDPDLVMQAFAFTASSIPTVVVLILLLRMLRTRVGETWALVMCLAYGFGSIALPFGTMYFGHAATTAFLFSAFYVLSRPADRGQVWRPLLGGLLAGWAVLVDVSAGLGVAALLLYALSRDRRAALLIVAGAVPTAVMLVAYNWISFGRPLSLGYANLANSGFASGMSQGILGVTAPTWTGLQQILLGPRGLLRLSPWFVATPLGLWAAGRPGLRREVVLCGGIVAGYVLANSGYYLPLGGATPGPRFLLPALPFATILVALVPRWLRPLIGVSIAVSVVVLIAATVTLPSVAEGIQDPLAQIWLPRLRSHDLGATTAWLYWGVSGLLPLFILCLGAATAALALWATRQSSTLARRLETAGVGLLSAMVVGFGTPADLSAVFGRDRASSTNPIDVAIVDAGITRESGTSPHFQIAPWVRVENRGRPLDRTMVVFSFYASSGDQVWSTWYGNVPFAGRARKRLSVEWAGEGAGGKVSPGEYRVAAAVTSADQQTIYARVDNVGYVRVVRDTS